MSVLELLRGRFPISQYSIVKLPDEELSWSLVKAGSVSIPAFVAPELSTDYALAYPLVLFVSVLSHPDIVEIKVPVLSAPPIMEEVPFVSVFSHPVIKEIKVPVLSVPPIIEIDLNLLNSTFQIINLLDPLAKPGVNGTIFVKKEEEQLQLGHKQIKTRVEPLGLRQKLDPKKPKGLDIFELLLPVLMPPATTEFRDELFFPQELYPYQRAGVKWLFGKESALLADDMGLGKTVQAITAFRALIRRGKASHALVICPKSVLTNWLKELERWAPELVAIRIHGSRPARHVTWQAYLGKCHVLVTTYETVRQDHDIIRGRFDLVVADEVQRIKNPDTDTSKVVRGLNMLRRWGLTGTPLENRLEDMISIFGFVKPGLFQTSNISLLLATVREHVRPYVLRRRKEEALPELPDKVIDTKLLELTESQRQTYDQAEREGVIRLRGTPDITLQHVLALIQKLKQICNFDPHSSESAKIEFLREEFLEVACQDDGKALIISQYVRTLEELEKHLQDYKPLLYTGQLSTAQRSKIEEVFGSKDEHKILLLSLRAGGLGLNLTRANYVLHFDRWWNPAVERQAEDRTHRIGQSRTVFVTRLICKDTIEERIEKILERKKILFQEVVDELTDVSLERVLSEEELFGLFGLTPPRRVREHPREPTRTAVDSSLVKKYPTAIEIKPEAPYSNLLSLRQILRRCERYIWWADRYFNARGLEELIYSVDPAMVREVHILSGPDNVDERAKHEFARFREELVRKAVSAEWRLAKGFAHDRFIISENACFVIPSIDTILRGQYSQIVETSNLPPFKDWWEVATPIENHQSLRPVR